jgi:hypothetical protein
MFAKRTSFVLIGLLLTSTSIAKLCRLLADSFADVRVDSQRNLVLIVDLELWLGLENFRIRDDRLLGLATTVVSAAFAIFASIRWLLGFAKCGCWSISNCQPRFLS